MKVAVCHLASLWTSNSQKKKSLFLASSDSASRCVWLLSKKEKDKRGQDDKTERLTDFASLGAFHLRGSKQRRRNEQPWLEVLLLHQACQARRSCLFGSLHGISLLLSFSVSIKTSAARRLVNWMLPTPSILSLINGSNLPGGRRTKSNEVSTVETW